VPVRSLRAVRSRLGDERGFTLTEMVVACVLGTLTLMVVIGLVDAARNASSRVEARVDGTQRGRVAMEQVTQRLRSQACIGTLTPIVAGDATSVTFYADLGGEQFVPEKRRLLVTGGDLKEQIWTGTGTVPDVTFPNAPTKERLVLKNVLPVKDDVGNDMPYFTFFAYDDQARANPSVKLSVPLSANDLKLVVRTQVAFKAKPFNKQDPRVDTNFVNAVTTRFAEPLAIDPTKRGPQCA
jgi:hypothetical protein